MPPSQAHRRLCTYTKNNKNIWIYIPPSLLHFHVTLTVYEYDPLSHSCPPPLYGHMCWTQFTIAKSIHSLLWATRDFFSFKKKRGGGSRNHYNILVGRVHTTSIRPCANEPIKGFLSCMHPPKSYRVLPRRCLIISLSLHCTFSSCMYICIVYLMYICTF